MGELLTFSPSSLMLLRQSPRRAQSVTSLDYSISRIIMRFPVSNSERNYASWKIRASILSDSKVPTTFTVDSPGKGVEILPNSGGSDDSFSGPSDGGGGGGSGDGNNGGDNQSGGSEDQSNDNGKKHGKGISMSQKLTLGYAALIAIGGIIGFVKGGSNKSLIAGGVSASVLVGIYTLLPSSPVLASSIGFVVSASLLYVMGSRFKKSGKIFPAGVVSGASLIMAGGYLHGILRSFH